MRSVKEKSKIYKPNTQYKNKFKVRDIQSAFRRCANSIVLENKHFEGERGLEMIAHQKPRLLEF